MSLEAGMPEDALEEIRQREAGPAGSERQVFLEDDRRLAQARHGIPRLGRAQDLREVLVGQPPEGARERREEGEVWARDFDLRDLEKFADDVARAGCDEARFDARAVIARSGRDEAIPGNLLGLPRSRRSLAMTHVFLSFL